MTSFFSLLNPDYCCHQQGPRGSHFPGGWLRPGCWSLQGKVLGFVAKSFFNSLQFIHFFCAMRRTIFFTLSAVVSKMQRSFLLALNIARCILLGCDKLFAFSVCLQFTIAKAVFVEKGVAKMILFEKVQDDGAGFETTRHMLKKAQQPGHSHPLLYFLSLFTFLHVLWLLAECLHPWLQLCV